MRVIISGGGTGGHIYPALAIIAEIKRQDPNSEFLYIGTALGLESDLVKREGIPFKEIEIQGFKRKLTIYNYRTIKKFIKATARSKEYIKNFKPDLVIGTGGYVCAPVLYAAAKLKLPTFLHEQNIVPGITNNFLSRYVDTIGISLEGAREHFKKGRKVVLTGNPISSEVILADAASGYEFLKINQDKKVILIFGGSRGAMPINQAIIDLIPQIEKRVSELYVLVTGAVNHEDVLTRLKESHTKLPSNLAVYPYLYNMSDVLKATTILISRAGASTLAEITALGLPTILIPSPYVTNNHQEKNAQWLEKESAALIVREKDLTAELLEKSIDYLLVNHDSYSNHARELGIPDAACRIYRELESLLKK